MVGLGEGLGLTQVALCGLRWGKERAVVGMARSEAVEGRLPDDRVWVMISAMNERLKSMAIETSGSLGSVAVGLGGQLVGELEFTADRAHGGELLPTMERLCGEQGWRPSEIERLYVSAGPGSFTGLRIAVTVAKTLAWAQEVQIVPVPSTEAMVLNAGEARDAGGGADGQVALVLDAKRKQIYTAVYEVDESGDGRGNEKDGFAVGYRCVVEPAVMAPGELLARTERPLGLLGEGLKQYEEELAEQAGVRWLGREYWASRARHVLDCGHRRGAAGLFCSAEELTPIYLRRPEAVERWEKLHGTD